MTEREVEPKSVGVNSHAAHSTHRGTRRRFALLGEHYLGRRFCWNARPGSLELGKTRLKLDKRSRQYVRVPTRELARNLLRLNIVGP